MAGRKRFSTLVLLINWIALAQVPYDPPILHARASIFNGTFNLPAGSSFNSVDAITNDAGEVTFIVGVLPGTTARGVWFGRQGSGSVVYTSPADANVSDITLNNDGLIIFEQLFVPPDGLYFFDTQTSMSGLRTNLPLGTSFWGGVSLNESGQIGYRAGFPSGQAFVSYDGTPTVAFHVLEAGLDLTSPYSFLFTPSFNDNRQIAGKVRLGAAGQFGESQPDQIRIFESNGASMLIAEDRDSNIASMFNGFDNAVALTNDGRVAFVGRLDGGARGVFLSDGTTLITIATTQDAQLSEIEFFAPSVNESGQVAFRGKTAAGLDALFVGDGFSYRNVVTEHDLVETDLGTGRIDRADESVVFGGGVCINASGDLAFTANLTAPANNQDEWGNGVFLLPAQACDTLFSDFLALWAMAAQPPCLADRNGNSRIDVVELIENLEGPG